MSSDERSVATPPPAGGSWLARPGTIRVLWIVFIVVLAATVGRPGRTGATGQVMQLSAHCGLGHNACNPVLDTLKRFRPAYERRLASLGFRPAFDLDGALAAARLMTGRNDAGAHIPSES